MIKIGDYNPKKVITKGKVKILDDKYVIKEKVDNNIFSYLETRNFNYFPEIIESDEKYDVTNYAKDIDYPREQKLYDLIDLTTLLHSKTTYFKEIDESKFSELYEDISNNILYLYSYYNDKATLIESKTFYSPSEYLLLRSINKIFYSLDYAKISLDELLETKEKKMRTCMIHNNLDLNHYIKGDRDYLISWNKAKFDMPIFDLYKLFKRNKTYNYIDLLDRYEQNYPLLEYEKKLLLIMLSMPDIIDDNKSEIEKTKEIKQMIINLEILPNYLDNKPQN
jgi:hypothetical protein